MVCQNRVEKKKKKETTKNIICHKSANWELVIVLLMLVDKYNKA